MANSYEKIIIKCACGEKEEYIRRVFGGPKRVMCTRCQANKNSKATNNRDKKKRLQAKA